VESIYIAGCGGMLGDAFYKCFSTSYRLKCTDIDVNAEWLDRLDMRDFGAYRADVEAFNPDYLFHLGALTDLEYCELHPEETYRTNTMSVENGVLIANRLNIPIIYISTAGIFDGHQDTYDDWDMPNPIGVYGRSKYMGERHVIENARRYLVCRAGWMMGGGPSKDKKFVNKLMKQLKAGKKELHIVNDKMGTPTYTHDFAANTKALLESGFWGLYNMVCEGITSRLDVAREMVRLLGLTSEVKINEVSSDYFKKEYFAARPLSERLINTKLKLRALNNMRDWEVALAEYLELEFKGYL
jgi:dTDP-4-dehydrorhamnose reductase